MKTQISRPGEILVIRLDSGDDILLSIREATREHDLQHALILGAMGSVQRYHVHVVETRELPPKDVFLQGEEPLDILSLNGVIMAGRVHAHISFSGPNLTMGGHLEEGCQILSFGQVWLVNTPDADLTDWDRIGGIG
ncbi:MAG: PPC domain-containing DNA-binding protein [Anaerolineales bacterium]